MMPSNLKYPDFVPDQLLTSENLNDLFRYLDEQGRMTRTNLLGVGIVCGFDVRTAADGTSIVVTKGTGVTTEGYLVAQEEMTYAETLPFDAAKEIYYDKFLTAAHLKKFDLWELKQAAAASGTTPLTQNFLNGDGNDNNAKVVLLFVELLQEQNKNCNPESCDDKGITINFNLRALLARKQDVDSFGLKAGISTPNIYFNNNFATLAELRMRRFDVAATTIVSSAGLFTAYKKILTTAFLSNVEHTLTLAWSHFKTVVGDEFLSANPFANLAEKFGFLNDGTINGFQLLQIQYIYAHFADLIAAYEEFRRTGMEVLGMCCPDAGLFPRHLLLDLAIKDKNVLHSGYRHHFRPSPLFQKRDLLNRLRSLFLRMALMVEEFRVPEPAGSSLNPDDFIRITPSRLDPSPLSAKAIPYYYQAAQPPANPLYKHWNYEKTVGADARGNLSYHAGLYATDDFVLRPLRYDLEPYNFLRVEGHLGKSFSHALLNVKRLIKENRLPIDVIGLCLGTDATDTEITDPKVLRDIQVQYEVLRTEILCCLKGQVGYWGKLSVKKDFKYGKLDLQSNLFSLFSGNLVMNFAAKSGLMNAGAAPAMAAGTAAAVASPSAASGSAPAAAPRTSASGGRTATDAAIDAAAAAAGPEAGPVGMAVLPGISRKADLITGILGEQQSDFLVSDYLKYQQFGDYNLSSIPAPSAVLDDSAVSHFALQILDEISELMVLLKAENPLTLDVDALTKHGQTLQKILDDLLARIEKEMINQRPFQKIKAYVGEAQATKVDAIAEAMPDLGDDQANTMVLLLLNLSEADKTTLINQLRSQRGNRANQVALINLFYGRLDKDGMQVPPTKTVPVVEDPFLKDMRDRIRYFSCLCSLAGFSKLRDLLRTLIEELKRANLFSIFTDKHPGIQPKAGVPMGGTFILAYVRKGTKAPDSPDAVYDKVAGEFADGMVVADFYLPYLSYSNHPPIVYQVNDAEPVPEKVTLALQPNAATGSLNFSVEDNFPYAFSHTPNSGTLTNGTPANGVTAIAADSFIFTPSQAKALLGNDFKKEIAFEYVKRGVASDKLKVTVFNLPTAEIKAAGNIAEVPPGTDITIKGNVNFADKFSWAMTDANGKSQEVATTKDLTGFTLAQEGAFTFRLTVTQSETGRQKASDVITVKVRKDEQTPAKTCGNLLLILKAFESLPAADPQRFKTFEAGVLVKFGIRDFFEKLRGVATASEAKQLEFFNAKTGNEGTVATTLGGWMQNLADIAIGERTKADRVLALALYRILAELLLYIACLRKTDLGKAEEQIFADLILQLKGQGRTKGLLALADLGAPEKAVLAGLRDDFKEEVERNAANNRINPKPKYARVLKAVAAAF